MLVLKTIKDYLDVVLEDDGTSHGGVSFVGETVADFIKESGISELSPLCVLNSALKECGIKPINRF